MGNRNQILIETKELTKVYSPRRDIKIRAVDAIDLKIYAGEFLAIIGQSGAGKTTLLNLIGALDRPTSGTLTFEGKEYGLLSRSELALFRRRKMGFIFQTFNLLPSLTALENIDIALAPTEMTAEKRKEKSIELLKKFDLIEKAEELPLQLSVGQQQKLAIARALANDPEIIFADEPTGEMDPVNTKKIVTQLVELNQENDVTIVVTSHGSFPYKISERVLYMKKGKIVSQRESGY